MGGCTIQRNQPGFTVELYDVGIFKALKRLGVTSIVEESQTGFWEGAGTLPTTGKSQSHQEGGHRLNVQVRYRGQVWGPMFGRADCWGGTKLFELLG